MILDIYLRPSKWSIFALYMKFTDSWQFSCLALWKLVVLHLDLTFIKNEENQPVLQVFCRVNMILFDLFFMGFKGIHQLIISIFNINTIPEQFWMKNQENTNDF